MRAAAVWRRALRRNGGACRSVRSLVRPGVPRGQAIAATLADLVSGYAAYALVGAAALAILWGRGEPGRALVAIGAVFLLRAAGVPLAIFPLDATTLGTMLRAIATTADAERVFASFVVASMAAALARVPGGLGAFEGACVPCCTRTA